MQYSAILQILQNSFYHYIPFCILSFYLNSVWQNILLTLGKLAAQLFPQHNPHPSPVVDEKVEDTTFVFKRSCLTRLIEQVDGVLIRL